VAAVRRVVECAPDLNIRHMTLYAFSSDNWSRQPEEIDSIFWLMRAYLRLEAERLRQRGVLLIVG
jgi:undecaprenyl diphosphate synthase